MFTFCSDIFNILFHFILICFKKREFRYNFHQFGIFEFQKTGQKENEYSYYYNIGNSLPAFSLVFTTFYFLFIVECLVQRPVNVKSRPRLPIPDDEDPYSIAGNNCISNDTSDSSGYSGSSNSNGMQCITGRYSYLFQLFDLNHTFFYFQYC